MSHAAQLTAPDPDVIAQGSPASTCWRSRQLALLASFGELAARDGPLERILHEACRVAAEGTEAPFAALFGYQPDRRSFVLRAGVGWRPTAFGTCQVPADLASTAGLAWHTRQPLRFGRSTFDGMVSRGYLRVSQDLVAQNVQRMISVPIRGNGETPFGVLEVGSEDRAQFEQTDLTYIEAVANIVAAAVRQEEWRASCKAQMALAEERQIQLKELHHRVGNDLQSITCLAEREARACGEPHRPAFQRVSRHVLALGDLYQHLNGRQSFATVDLGEHLRVLCVKIARTEELRTRQIAIHTELQPLPRDSTTAVRLAMAVNELVGNAVKHAFAAGTGGTIVVRLVPGEEGRRTTLSVSDDGRGFNGARPGSQGLDIVRRLVAFADAELSRSDLSGTAWTITLN